MRKKEQKEKKGLKKAAAKKVAKKAKVGAKAKKAPKKRERVKRKTAKKTVKKEIKKVKVEKKKPAKKAVKKEVKKVKAKVTKKVKKEEKAKKKVVVKKEKKVPLKPEKKVKAKKVAVRPEYPPLPIEVLPEEYGEDSITLMTVDPRKLFAYWEVREDTLARYAGALTLRVYDVTGVAFDGTNANSYFDVPVNQRIGGCYVDVSPEREFIVDMGILDPAGVFIMIARSNKVSTPGEGVVEESVLPERLYETGLPVGY